MGIAGAVAMIVSPAWEYARMVPDYRFLVEPWSVRGYELTQGAVISAMGVGLLLLFLNALRAEGRFGQTIAIAAGAWFAAILIAQFPDPPPIDFKISSPLAILVTFIVSMILVSAGLALFGGSEPLSQRAAIRWAGGVGLTVVLFLAVVRPVFVDGSTMNLSVIVAILLGIFLIAGVAGRPRELAPVRVLLICTFAAWIVVTTIGGSIRATLLRLQVEELGVAAGYNDTQITSGVMLAFAGSLLVFFGGVAVWARRRDHLDNVARARRQHEAAAESAAELEAAT
ncbi:MAG: hypothetical protein OEM22_03040 [Acidimicrobiia bacterium]|nr:hypothetical protein [Acidimicrobiia bacterium]